MERLLHPWRSGRLWPSLVHTVLDMPVGVVAFIPTVILSALTLGLAIVVPVAVVMLTALLVWTNIVGTVERSRLAALLGVRLEDPVPKLPKGSPWTKFKAAVYTWARWKQVGYGWLRLPVSGVLFAIVVGAWALRWPWSPCPPTSPPCRATPRSSGCSASPRGRPPGWPRCSAPSGWSPPRRGSPLLAGRLDTDARPLAARPAAREQAGGAGRAGRDAARAAAVDAAEAERRRIERDLHDGAQQRLVALAMDLGSARERLETDPEGGKALVAEAHEEAKAALKEIRDLVRGIHPVILEDRGLDAALSAVVARCPIPVELTVDLPERPPEAVESAAYFVVTEALTNVARHAHATRAHVGIVRTGDR